jgi:hypothetical protein
VWTTCTTSSLFKGPDDRTNSHTHTRTHTYTHTHAHTLITHTQTQTHTYIQIHSDTPTNAHTHTHVCTHTRTHRHTHSSWLNESLGIQVCFWTPAERGGHRPNDCPFASPSSARAEPCPGPCPRHGFRIHSGRDGRRRVDRRPT